MKTAIYIRVSTQEQAVEGFSLSAQTARLRAYCESQDWTIYDIYADEGVSAKDTERPQLQRLMNDIEQKRIDVVLVYKLDRLTRSVSDLYELLKLFDKHSVGFKSATEVFETTSAMGRLFITMVAAMAQWERETIAERVALGMDQKAREGRRVTAQAPFGYTYTDGVLHINPTEAEVVKEMFEKYASGEGIHRIRSWLLKRHPRNGSKWDNHSITYILDNPVYVGKLRWNLRSSRSNADLIITDGDHEPIIALDMWETVQEIRKRKNQYAPRSGTGRFPFAGIIYCARCGNKMQGHYGKKYMYYRCSSAIINQCDALLIRSEKVNEDVIKYLDRFSAKSMRTIKPHTEPKTNNITQDVERIKSSLQARKRRLWDAYELGAFAIDELRERLRRIQEEEANLEAPQTSTDKPSLADLQQKRELISQLKKGWESLDNLQRKELLRQIIDRVDVDSRDAKIQVTIKGV